MDPFEAINYLGQTEGRKLTIIKDIDDINTALPYFSIKDRKVVEIGGHKGHDNEDRLPFFAAYLEQKVFPYLDKEANLNGYYNIELHDTYSYLKNNTSYKNCLTWSKRKYDYDVILLPDLYQLCNYSNALMDPDKQDNVPWHNKINKVGFWGTTTGDRNPVANERLKTCNWAIDFKEETDFYITKVAQMSHDAIVNAYPSFDKFSRSPVSPSTMFKYKYLLDIPGNTCSWDRVPMILNSSSVLFKMPCLDMCFYYPLLHDGTHYIAVNSTSILQKRAFCTNNALYCRFITQSANKFAKDFLNERTAIAYLVALFESAAYTNI